MSGAIATFLTARGLRDLLYQERKAKREKEELLDLAQGVTKMAFAYEEAWSDPDRFTDLVLEQRLEALRAALKDLQVAPGGEAWI